MVESMLMAESSIHKRVFLRMYKNSRMISDGPAANAVEMKRIGIMLVLPDRARRHGVQEERGDRVNAQGPDNGDVDQAACRTCG